MITLCYVEGIDEVDTPWFDTIGEQTAFFDKHIVWHDDESYYPPYFMNAIRLSSEDIPFNSSTGKVNYCFLDYEGKRYYYFIDSIDYVTDDLVEITIEMDTIQTYLFDMLISKPTISRMAIKRWGANGDAINRDYIRENLSIGNMIQKSKVPMREDDMGWLVITASDEIPNLGYVTVNDNNNPATSSHSGLVSYKDTISGKSTTYRTNGLYTYLIPYTNGFDRKPFIYVQYGLKDPFKMINPQKTLETLSSSPNVLSIKYVPSRMFADIALSTYENMPLIKISPLVYDVSYKDNQGVSHTDTYNWFFFVPFSTTTPVTITNGFVIDYPDVSSSVLANVAEFGFGTNYPTLRLVDYSSVFNAESPKGNAIVMNRTKGVPYSSKFIPAMIDESYMRITGGDTGTTCVAPLYYATQPSGYVSLFSTIDGAIAYYITFDGDLVGTFGGAVDDPHGTAVINENAMEYTLRTDPWKQYQVTHKGSIITDWIASGAGAVTKVAGVASMAGVADKVTGGSSPTETSAGTDYSGLVLTADGYSTGFTRYRMPRFINVPRRGEKGRYTRNELYPI